MTLDPIKAAIAPYALLIKCGLALLLVGSLFVGGCNHGASKWRGKYDAEVAAHKADNASHARVLADLSDKTKAAETAAKLASDVAIAERTANNKRFQEAKDEAAKARNALAGALRAGRVRLRDEWTCPAARPAEGEAGAASGRQDAAAELRATGAADLVAAGAAADRWIGWLQSELITTRTACGVVP